MYKSIFVSVLCLSLVACGGDDAKDMAKEKAKSAVEVVTEKAGVSEDVSEKINNMADKAIEHAGVAFDKKQAVSEAKQITKAFGGALKARLQAAMKEGGPVNALDVCSKEAVSITAQVAKEKGALISRVSLKNRNQMNVPNEWQKKVLEDFDARAAKGEDIKKMGFAKIVEHDGKKQLRFMKALPTGGLCLKCHGSNIEANVQEKLSTLYPDDKAIGYALGQVRGAVVVIKDLN